MEIKPDSPDVVTLLRNADETEIRLRLDALDGERAALRTLLRSVIARNRASNRQQHKDGGKR